MATFKWVAGTYVTRNQICTRCSEKGAAYFARAVGATNRHPFCENCIGAAKEKLGFDEIAPPKKRPQFTRRNWAYR